MALIINQITKGSLQVTYNYIDSEYLFGLTSVGSYTVNVADIQFANENTLLNGIDALREAYERKIIVARIGGDEYKNGRIVSMSFKENAGAGNMQATFSIEQLTRPISYTNNTFADLIPNPQWIESFTESYSFNRNDDVYSFSRNINIKWKQSDTSDFLYKARLAIQNFFFERKPNFGSIGPSFDDGWKTNKTENIDLINLTVSLSENFDSSLIDELNGISKKTTYTNTIDENGFTTKSYTIELKALQEPLELNISNAIAREIDYICTQHSPQTPLSIEKGINKDGGIANISISFSNDPAKANSNSANYTIAKNKAGAYYEYNVSATYQSQGNSIENRFLNTKAYAKTFHDTLKNKIQILFPEAGSSIYEKSCSLTFNKFENNNIVDSTVFSNDPAYNVSYPVLKSKMVTSDSKMVNLTEKTADMASKTEVVIQSSNKTIPKHTMSYNTIIAKSEGIFAGDKYLDSIFEYIYAYPAYFIESDNVSIETANGTTNRVINYSTITE